MKHADVVGALGALAQGTRLAVYRLLVMRGPEGFAAGEIGEKLEIPGPTLSFHLKQLVQAGLVSARKESRFVYYAANYVRMNSLLGYLTENCCGVGTGCTSACIPEAAKPRKRKSATPCSTIASISFVTSAISVIFS